MTPKYIRDLRRNINRTFNDAELKILVHDVNIDWDHLVGEEKLTKIQSFLKLLQRDGKLDDLTKFLREERPNETWEEPPPEQQQIEDAKLDITTAERKVIFDNLVDKAGPLVAGVLQIKTLVEANIDYLDARQTGDLVRLLARGHLDTASYIKLESISLKNEQLNQLDLRGINFKNANLRGTNFKNANLSETNLYQANLIGANLEGVNLTGANLIGANLEGANLIGANLQLANLSHARLKDANLAFAHLIGTELGAADLRGAILNGAELGAAHLRDANYIRELDPTDADLRARVINIQIAFAILDETTIMSNGEKWKPSEDGPNT